MAKSHQEIKKEEKRRYGYQYLMKKIRLIAAVMSWACCSLTATAQTFTSYRNNFDIRRSAQYGFRSAYLLTGCPQTNEYQVVEEWEDNSHWERKEMGENGNGYLVMSMDRGMLGSVPRDFRVCYTFRHAPRKVHTDFSALRNDDGSWKPMPPYDTKAAAYKENTRRSGDYIVPGNKNIKAISGQLLQECDSNLMAYAEACYTYVAAHYRYMKPMTGLHTISEILKDGGGDCGNLSSIYISLLRAQGIPARHVQAIRVNDYHIWAEFFVQDFGWVPVDVTYKNSNPRGDFFGRYDGKWVVVQRGVNLKYSVAGSWKQVALVQEASWWYWYDTPATLSATQHLTIANAEQ